MAMTHIAIQEALDGKVVEWMEKVSDAEYKRSGSRTVMVTVGTVIKAGVYVVTFGRRRIMNVTP